MKTKLFDALQVMAAILISTSIVVHAAPIESNEAVAEPQSAPKVEKVEEPESEPKKPVAAKETAKKEVSDPNNCEPERYWAKEPPYECIDKPKTTSQSAAAATTTSQPASAGSNESIVWQRLRAAGYTRNQTAGIMGNLQQEHGFRTDGDGLAQWLGGRRANLMARANPYSIETQISFLLEELNGPYAHVKSEIKSTDSVEAVVIAFQDRYEICHPAYCMQSQRINYAYGILNRY